MSDLEELLKLCSVKLSLPDDSWGTGFFVAPGLILTCAHVVKTMVSPHTVEVCWQQQLDFSTAKILQCIPNLDLALLQFTSTNTNLPCVYLDEQLHPGQNVYFFGYPDKDFDQGCPATGCFEGLTGDVPPFIKFKDGQVRQGMSGSALLNQNTGKVCGIVKFTRDDSINLGGGAIPTNVILEQFPQLRDLQRNFHQQDRRWSILLNNSFKNKNLDTVKNVYYENLQSLLKQGLLEDADDVTTKIMLLAANQEDEEGFDEESLKIFPDSDLLKLDAIWKTHNPKFGFSVQKQIFFEEVAGDIKDFAKCVGWKDKTLVGNAFSWRKRDKIIYDPSAPPGHLPWSWANLRNYFGGATPGSVKRIKLLLSRKNL